MSKFDPIENDKYYKILCALVVSSDFTPVERILFLSTFESWYHFQDYELYTSISLKAIEYFEGVSDA